MRNSLKQNKLKSRCTVIAFIGGAAAVPFPLLAQQAPTNTSLADDARPAAEDAGGLSDIVVTARRRAENLQNVPISVTAFSGAEIADRQIRRLEDIQQSTPNLRMRDGGGNASAAVFSIRGQVNNEIIATQDASVGLYVDDLIWARAIGANANLLDMASAQVLKGPQGTLFGRNTTGGAIVLRTNDPDPNTFSGSVKLGFGRFNRKDGSAILNVPLGENVAIRGAIQRVKAGPMFKNDFGANQGEEDVTTGRFKFLAEPTDRLKVVLSYELFHMDQDAMPWFVQFYNPGAAGANAAVSIQQAAGANFGSPAKYIVGPDFTRATTNTTTYTKATTQTANGVVTYDLGEATLKAIGGYRTVRHHTLQDLDGTPYLIQTTDGTQDIGQYTGELQINGKAFDNRLDYSFGVFAFREKGYDTSTSIAIPPVNPGNPNYSYGDVKNTSKAIYGQISYKITDALNFTGGLRYSNDKKSLVSHSTTGAGASFVCGVPLSLRADPAVCVSVPIRTSDDGLSYTAGLDYRISAGILVYAKTSRGFRSGGLNLRAQGNLSLFNPFKPEQVTDYEIGFKSDLFDRRVRLNIAGFYSDYKDIQRNQNITVLTPTGGTTTLSTVVNAATARIIGGEAELQVAISNGIRFDGGLGLTYPKYTSFSEPRIVGGTVINFDRSNEPFDFVPKMTANAGLQYSRKIGVGDLMLRADYNYTSTMDFVSNFTPAPAPARDRQKPVSLVNLRGSLTVNESLEFSVYGRNVFGKRYNTNALDFSGALGVAVAYPAPRPSYGMEVTFRF